jgi:hypothetical protein
MCLGKLNPVRGFWSSCTDGAQRRLERRATSTETALRAVSSTRPGCVQAMSVATHVVEQLTAEWRRAWLAVGHALRTGALQRPPPATVEDRAEQETTTDTRLVPGLAAGLRRSCA